MAEENLRNKSREEKRERLILNLAKIFCVIIAFGLWIYVMMVESPSYEETFYNVMVDLTNTDSLKQNNLAVYNGYGNLVDVTLSGKKSVISNLNASDIVVTADISSVAGESGRYNVKVNVDVPSGCKLVGTSSETVSVYLDQSSQKVVDITERRINTNLPEGTSVGTIELPVDKITVTGPSIVLARVTKAVMDIDMSGITKTTSYTARITLYDDSDTKVENPYLDYYPKEVTFTIPVSKTVSVDLGVYFKHGFLNEDNTEVTIVPASVNVTGDSDLINRGGLVDLIEIDEKTDFVGTKCNMMVTLKSVDGVTLSTGFAEVTAVIGDSIRTRKITISGDNISVKNLNEGVHYEFDKVSTEVTLLGTMEALSAISADDVTIELDLSPYFGPTTGTYYVRGTVSIDTEFENEILDVGTYEIPVTFVEYDEDADNQDQ